MTEEEYIIVSDLAKVKAARNILKDATICASCPTMNKAFGHARQQLFALEQMLEDRAQKIVREDAF